MKKILAILFVIIITLSLSLISFGAQTDAPDTEGNASHGTPEIDPSATDTEKSDESENIFTTLYMWVCDNSGEIFSFLTLVSSVILAFTYKRGLLPRLSGALGKLGGAVGTISKSCEGALGTLDESFAALKEGLSSVSGLCEGLSDEVSELSARLEEAGTSKDEVEKMKLILSSQVDMLYEIFLSSALPQFAKEAVAERVTAMRRMLSGGTENE